MSKRTPLFICCLFLIIGSPRIFTLSAHWGSDESLWLHRSDHFMEAVKAGQFQQTLQAYHPGVTTMWLGGLRTLFSEHPIEYTPQDLAISRWGISGAILICLVGIGILLHRLFAFGSAAFACFFLCLDPFFLSESRSVHTDALATTFMLLTVLLFLLYCQNRQHCRYLLCSGIAYGLALLSKSYAVILLPWIPLCLWLFRSRNTSWRVLVYNIWMTAFFFISWSLLTVFLVWPLFWHPLGISLGVCLLGSTVFIHRAEQKNRHVRRYLGIATLVLITCTGYAVKNVWLVWDRVGWALTTAHNVEHFFFGKIVADPGWLFYPIALSIKSTPFVLPLAIGAIMFFWKHRHEEDTANHFKVAIALVLVVVLFTGCLSLTAKKFPRYLLPAFPMLDILAGMGLFYIVKWIGTGLKKHRLRKIAQAASVVIVLLLTAVPVFALHPYYGTYYNLCWKVTDITKFFTVGDGSGLDIAAKYLNNKPKAAQMTVQVSTLGAQFFYPYFDGNVYQLPPKNFLDASSRPPVDYEVVYIRDSQIKWVPSRSTRGGTLEHVITLNGIDHVWIYRVREERK